MFDLQTEGRASVVERDAPSTGPARLSGASLQCVLASLLCLGALFWAKGRDPFQRIRFEVKVPGHGRVECIAVLPKMGARPLPVVIYLHGSGGSLLGDGNELRQLAEMGLAAVGMEYEQKTEDRGQKSEVRGRSMLCKNEAQCGF